MFLVLGLVVILPCLIIFQIFRIQFMQGDNLRALWNAQALDYITIPAQRGNIVDSNGLILATNTTTYSLAVDPHAPGVTAEHMNLVTGTLSHFTENSQSRYQRRIQQAPRGSRYIVLSRGLDRVAYDSLRSLRVRGIILEENYRRRYNFDQLAAHAIGHVNHNMAGVMGLESYYNDYLRGEDGIQQVRKDSRNRIRAFVGAPRKQPVQGHTIQTTINARIQAIVEEELKNGVQRARAKQGTAVMVNPRTGEVVAMANYPTYNPNLPGTIENENRRNNAIADMIEPGSTFKLVTAIAALEQNVVDLYEVFDTPDNGRVQIHGQWMRDHDPLGSVSFSQAMQKSSNIATAEVAMRLKPDTFYQYARNLGFGTSTSIDLPGEESGRLQRPHNWSLVTLPWMSVGYEVQVTPLQMAMAYAAFANGGKVMRPYVVSQIHDERGRVIHQNRPHVLREAIKPQTIRDLTPVFESVLTEEGTAQFAAVEGLSIAAKTGTAQKFVDGRYRARYRASIVGFYPTENPKYVCFILLDEPRTSIYGGFMAGPILRNIAKRVIGVDEEVRYYVKKEQEQNDNRYVPRVAGLNLDLAASLLQHQNLGYTVEGHGTVVLGQEPAAGSEIPTGQKIVLLTSKGDEVDEDTTNRIPEVRGMSMRQAVVALRQAGYEVNRHGSGTVYNQFPAAGAVMKQGRAVTIRGRARPMEVLAEAAN